jgi:hypothetical protein
VVYPVEAEDEDEDDDECDEDDDELVSSSPGRLRRGMFVSECDG